MNLKNLCTSRRSFLLFILVAMIVILCWADDAVARESRGSRGKDKGKGKEKGKKNSETEVAVISFLCDR